MVCECRREEVPTRSDGHVLVLLSINVGAGNDGSVSGSSNRVFKRPILDFIETSLVHRVHRFACVTRKFLLVVLQILAGNISARSGGLTYREAPHTLRSAPSVAVRTET